MLSVCKSVKAGRCCYRISGRLLKGCRRAVECWSKSLMDSLELAGGYMKVSSAMLKAGCQQWKATKIPIELGEDVS